MTIQAAINQDLKDAMRARDKKKLNILRLVTAAIKQIEVDERIDVDEARMLVILNKMAKQRKESISQFEKAARQDLIDQELYELEIINAYLPEPMSSEKVSRMVKQLLA